MAETYVSDQHLTAEELAAVSDGFETAPASAVIRWAIETFGDSLVLAASFEDIVLIDLVTKVAPAIEVVFLDTEAHFPETLVLRRRDAGALRAEPHRDEARPRGGGLPLRYRSVLPVPQGGAVAACPRGQARLADVAQAIRRPHPRRRADRQLGRGLRAREGQPARDLDRATTSRPTSPTTSCRSTRSSRGLPLHRVRADDPPGGRRGGRPRRSLGRCSTSPSAACTSSAA